AIRQTEQFNKRGRKAKRDSAKNTVSISTSYISLLYGILTLLVVFSIIFLAVNFFSKKPQGTISDSAASTVRLPTRLANVPISNPLTPVQVRSNPTKQTVSQTPSPVLSQSAKPTVSPTSVPTISPS